jgi:transposase
VSGTLQYGFAIKVYVPNTQTLRQYPDSRREAASAHSPRQNGRRGRVAKSDAHYLWERLKRYEETVLLFAKLPQVPFTNNRPERDLRMSKVKQKVSGCFRTRHYAEANCRISSYLQTMASRGHNPLVAI